jgi:hypothetical protein
VPPASGSPLRPVDLRVLCAKLLLLCKQTVWSSVHGASNLRRRRPG